MAKSPFTIERNVTTPMRDTTRLAADVYVPDGDGPFPTLVCRTPYNKQRDSACWEYEGLAHAGYAVVVQDIRGRFASEGDFHPLFLPGWTDAEDGYDTIEWAAAQPWSNGQIGTFGNSYNSWTQWALAPTKPPHLVAMWASGMAPHTTDWEIGGIFRPGRALQWLLGTLAPDTQARLSEPQGPATVEEWDRLHAGANREKWLWFLPWSDLPAEAVGGTGEQLRDWLQNHTRDVWRFHERFADIDVPVFHRTGWYDRLIRTVDMFAGMQRGAPTEHARRSQRLIVGPWPHSTDYGARLGEIDFGPESNASHLSLVTSWFDYWLKGEENGVMDSAPARLFLIGANRWVDADAWPPPGSTPTDLYLRGDGRAATPRGDGALDREGPGEEPPDRYSYDPRDRYSYDPRDPVMTLYGANGHDEPHDQRLMDHRRDVLVYQTPPLESPLTVCGCPEVTLWASSSAPDTDFVARLIDVHPDGFAQNVVYGIVRARYRAGFERPELLLPGEVYELKIELLPICNRFLAGHRLRLDISSSDFPNFDRNHNTGRDDWADAELRVAKQTVFHDPARPSRLTLPVMPQDWGGA